jgi:pimeloyl-ACP methyl ester carboxylesterase
VTTDGEARPSSRRIDIGARALAVQSRGEGSPAVVLETGLAADSDEWDAVQRGSAAFARVHRYDRAGRGASAAASTPRGALDLVDDLHALLHTPGLRDGPCVLVGHSLGGLLVRLYAQLHPRDVAALVLVDSMHEAQFDRLGPLFPPPSPDESPTLRSMRAFWREGWRDPAHNAESLDLPRSFAQLGEAPALPAGLPLTVLSAGGFLDARLFERAAGHALQRRWLKLQGRLAAAARPLEQLYVESSGHFMQRDAPQVIVDAVARLVRRLRAA